MVENGKMRDKRMSTTNFQRLIGLLLLGMGIALFALTTNYASAATLYVDDDAPDGGDGSLERPYNRIQDAVNAAGVGDTIRVWEGTYYAVDIDKTISMIGNGSANTEISIYYSSMKISSNWTNISGFSIKSYSDENSFEVLEFDSASHCNIFNISLDIYSTALRLRNSHFNTFQSMDIISQHGDSVNIEDSHHNSFTNTYLFHYNYGFQSENSNFTTISHNVLESDRYMNSIWLKSSENNTISDNGIINNESSCLVLVNSHNTTMVHNNISADRGGIIATNSNDLMILENTIRGKDYDGIALGGCENVLLYNNTIQSDHSAIDLSASSNITISSNLLKESGCGVNFDSQFGGSGNTTIIKNNMSSVSNGIQCGGFGNNYIAFNRIFGRSKNNGRGITLWCPNNTIMDNYCSNFENGIYAGYNNNDTTIQNNSISQNSIGISLSSFIASPFILRDFSISQNIIYSNADAGIVIGSGNHKYSAISHNLIYSNNGPGIGIANAENITIENNIIKNNSYGISSGWNYKYSAKNNSILNNTILSSTKSGISLIHGEGYHVENNIISNYHKDYYSGIWLESTEKCQLLNNTVCYNWYGIAIYSSLNSYLSGNNISNNEYNIYIDKEYSTQQIDTTNLVDGKSIYYLVDKKNITINSSFNPGFIALINASYIIIENIDNLSVNYCGILIFKSDNISVRNSTITKNKYGIYIYRSTEVDISNCVVTWNDYHGIYLEKSDVSKIIANNILYSGDGIRLVKSKQNTIESNIVNNNQNGIVLYQESNTNAIKNNACESNEYYGVVIYSSQKIALNGNRLNGNLYNLGIFGDFTTHNIDESNLVNGKPVFYIVGKSDLVIDTSDDPGYICVVNSKNITIKNISLSNNGYGATISSSTNCTLENVNFSLNSYGIYIDHSSNITMNNVNVINNFYRGLYGWDLDESEIMNCSFENNNGFGMYLSNFNDNVILNCRIESNKGDGIYITHSSRNRIINNFISNNTNGINGRYSRLEIRNNTFVKNQKGIYFYDCIRNEVTHNRIESNKVGIKFQYQCGENKISYNNIFNNTQFGIDNIYGNEAIDAKNNWWGNISGPFSESGNLNGSGDNVTQNVEFEPWLIQPFNDPPTANAGKTQIMLIGEIVAFYGIGISEDGNIMGYQWDLDGDGFFDWNSSNSGDTTYIYNVTGVYHVKLQITDNQGQTATDICIIIVTVKPKIEDISITPNSALNGENIHFFANASDDGNVTSFIWISSVDGEIYNGSSPIFYTTQLSNGSHMITCRIQDELGIWSYNVSTNITINGLPIAHLNFTLPNFVEETQEVTFSGHGTDDGTIVKYLWRSSIDGTLHLGSSSSIIISNLSIGNHIIYFYVLDNNGKWSKETNVTLVVKEKPIPENQKPIVSFTNPKIEETVKGMLIITGISSDPDGTVKSVKISFDGDEWKTALGNESWNYEVDTTKFENGNLSIRIRSYDGTNYSEEVSITVIVDNEGNDGGEDDDDGETEESKTVVIVLSGVVILLIIAIGITFYVKKGEISQRTKENGNHRGGRKSGMGGEKKSKPLVPTEEKTEDVAPRVPESTPIDESFKPKPISDESCVELVGDEDVDFSDEDIEVVEEPPEEAIVEQVKNKDIDENKEREIVQGEGIDIDIHPGIQNSDLGGTGGAEFPDVPEKTQKGSD